MSDNGDRKRLQYTFDERGRQIISRAILLRHAVLGSLGETDLDGDGEILTDIVAAWLDGQSKRIAEGGKA